MSSTRYEAPIITPLGNMHDLVASVPCSSAAPSCRSCGCTSDAGCIVDEGNNVIDVDTGTTLPLGLSICYWVEPDLCSACVQNPPPPLLYGADGQPMRRGAP